MKSWLASIALHGVMAVLAAMLWLMPEAHSEAQPMRWTVVFTQPTVAPVREEAPARPPPASKKIVRTKALPASPALAPPPASPPQPGPSPVDAPPPGPVAEAVVLAPPASQAVEQPAVLAHAAVKTVAEGNAPRLSSASTGHIPESPQRRSSVPVVSAGQTGVGEAEAAATERRWYQALLECLRAMKRYPPLARRLGQEGVVLIEARISPDGRLEDASVKKGSGYPLLDRDALRLLEAAAEMARGRLRPDRPANLEIPIAYRLEG